MADSSDAKPIDAVHGPEGLDASTLQGLPSDAVNRIQGFTDGLDATTATVFCDVPLLPPMDMSYDYSYFTRYDVASRLVEVGFNLFVGIGREYLRGVPKPRQFDSLLYEAQERIIDYTRNRLIEIVTGKTVEKWTNSRTPTESELNHSELWNQCEKVSRELRDKTHPIANRLKAEARERNMGFVRHPDMDYIGDDASAPVEPLPEPAADSEDYKDRRLMVDSYIKEVFQATGKKIVYADVWRAAGDHERTEFGRWLNYFYEKHEKKTNQAAHNRFMLVLRTKPHLK